MNKLWKAAGILGGVLVVTAGSGTLVLADETSTEVTDDNSGSSVLDTDEWAQKAAANVTDYANIRQEGSKESERVGVLPKGAAAQVIEQQGDWTKITSGSVEGYVKSDLLVFGEEAKHLYGYEKDWAQTLDEVLKPNDGGIKYLLKYIQDN